MEKWKNFHDEIIGAIRATGAQNIIVVDEHNWGQANGYSGGDADSAVLTQGAYLSNKYGTSHSPCIYMKIGATEPTG
ncbi:cellulase family glycosylhydrolase [Paenibacillus rhizosphaerae]|uniref:cellulase family glycosylhydrolase n=1 Tax=Paenibacillus rhizosphaerae TaxID=297318 RepID=UPI001611CFE6